MIGDGGGGAGLVACGGGVVDRAYLAVAVAEVAVAGLRGVGSPGAAAFVAQVVVGYLLAA